MSIQKKILLLLALFAVIPASTLGVFTYYSERASLQAVRLAQLDSIASLIKDRIESHFTERKNDVVSAAHFPAVRTHLPVLVQHASDPTHPEAAASKEALDRELKPYRELYGYHDILLTDAHSAVVYVANNDHVAAYLGHPFPDKDLFETAKWAFGFSGVKMHRIVGERAVMAAAAPVLDLNGSFIGEILFEIDLGQTRRVVLDRTGLGETGDVVVARRDGNTALFLFPVRSDPDAALKRHVPLDTPYGTPIQLAVREKTGSGRTHDYRGVDVLATWRYLPTLGWGVVAKIDAAEAFAPIVRYRNLVVIFGGLVLIAGFVSAFLAARTITAPILRLQRDTEIISEGDLDHDVATDAKDEVGQFSRAFALMTRRLKEKIAEQGRTADELEKHLGELENTNRELNEFAHVASHDLKAPLHAIASLATLLAHDYGDRLDEKGRGQVGLLLNRVRRMNNLIEGILQYSRIGRAKIGCCDVDLDDVLAHTIDTLAPAPQISVVVERRLPVVRCDRTQMQQVFQNLVGNAIKFMDKPEGRIGIGWAEVDGVFQFHVTDNGPGIAPEHHERVFKIFQTLRNKDEFESTGIGLAIVKKIVEGYGGRIWLESAAGRGSTFFFTIGKRAPSS